MSRKPAEDISILKKRLKDQEFQIARLEREGEIEAALEKVRAASMAMQNSDELSKVVRIMYEQLLPFEIGSSGCELILCNEETDELEFWNSSMVKKLILRKHSIPRDGHSFFRRQWKAWKQNDDRLVITLKGKKKREFDDHIFSETEFQHLPDEVIKFIRSTKVDVFSHAIMKYGLFESVDSKPLSEDKFQIIERFANVFEQTYTRFLDLQKAEVQARKAQIEAALEKVRAASMAMHKTEEIADVVVVLFNQLKELNLEFYQSWINIYHLDQGNGETWMSPLEEFDDLPFYMKIPSGGAFEETLLKPWKEGNDIFNCRSFSNQEAVNELFHLFDARFDTDYFSRIQETYRLERLELMDVRHAYGTISISTKDKASEDFKAILKRFAKVFEQTYTRFLDLQKAEIQAREAQIEAALERVRSRTMAMHQSDELRSVIAVLFQQLQALHFDISACGIIIINKKDKSFTQWMAGFGSDIYPESYSTPYFDHPYYQAQLKAWQSGLSFKEFCFEGELKITYYELIFKLGEFKKLPNSAKAAILNVDNWIVSDAFMTHGMIEAAGHHSLTKNQRELLKRFAKVFEQTYTRFLDLQKVEEQARESQIEASLERVRSASMAMHKTSELSKVVTVLFNQFQSLDIDILLAFIGIYHIEEKYVHQWFSPIEGVKEEAFFVRLPSAPWESTTIKDWKAGKEMSYESIHGKEAVMEYSKKIDAIANWNLFEDTTKKLGWEVIEQTEANHQYGNLSIVQNRKATPSEINILKRFALVFEQAYTRFLDLQKAEAQAREAQIEAAMERIRSRAIAMRSSEELKDVIIELRRQIDALGQLDLEASVIHLYEKGGSTFDSFAAVRPPGESGEIVVAHVRFPVDAMDQIEYMVEMYHSENTEYTIEFDKAMAEEWQQVMVQHAPMIAERRVGFVKNRRTSDNPEYWNFVDFSHGSLLLVTHSPASEDTFEVLRKASQVFDQAYTRFLDLQKAEAQAREAQIEAALERVRAAGMAMHKSSDLYQAAAVVFKQLELLGAHMFASAFALCNEYSTVVEQWLYAMPVDEFDTHHFDHAQEPVHHNLYKAWQSQKPIYEEWIRGEVMANMAQFLMAEPTIKENLDKLAAAGIEFPMEQKIHAATFSHGYLMIITLEDFEETDIFVRFAKVFEQTFTRYLDLKKAEELAREAQIETALERVRARSMAMQSSNELADVANILYAQLGELGAELWCCGFAICKDDEKIVEKWMSTLIEGQNFVPLLIPYDADHGEQRMYDAWKDQVSLDAYEQGGQELKEIYDNLMTMSSFCTNFQQVIEAGTPFPSWQMNYIAPFEQGYLLIITTQRFEETSIFSRMAKVFQQTYTRFLDLQKVEEQARVTDEQNRKLAESYENLKATQAQLIQAEKMASLGELTAGIAHEIQNPLNFVNNFSEVNTELLDELEEEISNGEMKEVTALIKDLKGNLEKITHHGKRADGIVKGMLQHSRSSSGEKMPTDLNELAEEYLRLAYHGLRAKDNSFNSEFEAHLHPNLPKLNVIPQDIGRVLLNLINNAFQAVLEKSRESNDGYAPKVTVSSKLSPLPERQAGLEGGEGGGSDKETFVQVLVKDNGPGIPDSIKEKIFQPFFTTKPTGEGTGLGLSLSYDIVKSHGGEIKVESKEGKGTEFILYLPIV